MVLRGLALVAVALAAIAWAAGGSGRPRSHAAVPGCGVSRLAVRTLSDAAARKVDFRPTTQTVAQLGHLKTTRPSAGRARLERRTFRVQATLVEARADRAGVELLVADPQRPEAHLEVEFPHPRCLGGLRPLKKRQLTAAYSTFTALCGWVPNTATALRGSVTITGVAFVRSGTGGQGTPNGLQLQPVLGFQSQSCGGAPEATMLAAGDIAGCGTTDDDATARLVGGRAGTVATLGDNAYESGSASEYARCYGPTWGRVKARTRPAPGNHEYGTPGAEGYFGYFGAAAGPPGKGYYSYDLGRWHIAVVNSNCGEIGGCGSQSAQGRWLRDDLAGHQASCTLAYWHHPRFSSGIIHGSSEGMTAIWQILYAAGADVVLSGHEHNYERFTPQTPQGKPDGRLGIREFVVGTGGRNVGYPFGTPLPTSEVRRSDALGVLRLQLHPNGYDWRFLSVPGRSFADKGAATCH